MKKPEHVALIAAVLIVGAVVYRMVRPTVNARQVRPKAVSPYSLDANR